MDEHESKESARAARDPIAMIYRERPAPPALSHRMRPAPPALSPWVHFFWEMRGGSRGDAVPMTVLPDGCVDLVIYVQPDSVYASAGQATAGGAHLVGLRSGSLRFELRDHVHVVGACIRATATTSALDIEPHAVAGRVVRLDEFAPRDHLAERVVDGPADDSLDRLVEALTARLRHAVPPRDVLSTAVALLQRQRGRIDVESLADRLSVSRRQLERRFMAGLAISPKQYARIIRFDHTVRDIRATRGHTLSQVALRHGYHDQSHFNHEFRRFADMTPREFVAQSNSP
jgi:AraC-like DNA-binding protein